jgi:hypothetical protein
VAVKNTHIIFANFGNVLATREQGRRVGELIDARALEPTSFLLNFDGVAVLTPPFLSQTLDAIYNALKRHRDEGSFAATINLDEDNLETLKMVIDAGDWPGLAYAEDDAVELLNATPQLAETLREAQRLGPFIAPQLAERMGLKLPAANQRLSQLVEAGAMARWRDASAARGKRYQYEALRDEHVHEMLEHGAQLTAV